MTANVQFERQLPKLNVSGSNPDTRSSPLRVALIQIEGDSRQFGQELAAILLFRF
jgi:hypothetical protein